MLITDQPTTESVPRADSCKEPSEKWEVFLWEETAYKLLVKEVHSVNMLTVCCHLCVCPPSDRNKRKNALNVLIISFYNIKE